MMKEIWKKWGFIISLFSLLTLWFVFGYGAFTEWASKEYLTAYLIFLIGYSALTLQYVIGLNILKNLPKLAGWILIFLALDIISFPLLVTPDGLATQDTNARMSSDVFIWYLIPNGVSAPIKFYLTYIVIPMAMIIAARWLLGRKFNGMVRNGI